MGGGLQPLPSTPLITWITYRYLIWTSTQLHSRYYMGNGIVWFLAVKSSFYNCASMVFLEVIAKDFDFENLLNDFANNKLKKSF